MRRLFWGNPVLQRELQERVLSRRTAFMVTGWISLLCIVSALYYAGEVTDTFNGQFGGNVLRLAAVGQNLFDWLLFFMIGLVLFLVPGFTAASIAGERERQTLQPMQVTLLRPIDIVVGKITASVVFVLVLIAVTTPVLAFAYIIGGVTIGEVFVSLAMLAFSAMAIACLTVACSALVRRVPGAIVTAYGLVLLLTVGSFAAYGIAAAVDSSRGFDAPNPPLAILAMNPVVALADVSDSSSPEQGFFFVSTETPMAGIRSLLDENRLQNRFDNAQFPVGFPGQFGPVGQAIPVPVPMPDPIPMPFPPALEQGLVFEDPAVFDGPFIVGPDGEPIPLPTPAPMPPGFENGFITGPDGELIPLPPVPVLPPGLADAADAAAAEAAIAVGEAAAAAQDAAIAAAEAAQAEAQLFEGEVFDEPPFPPDVFFEDQFFGNQFEPQPIDEGVPFWLQYVMTMTALSGLSIWLATRRLRTPAQVER